MNANANINDRGTGQGASPGEQCGQHPQVHFVCVEMVQSGKNDVNGLCGDAKKDLFEVAKQITVDCKESQLCDDGVKYAQYKGVKQNKSGDFNEVQQTDFNTIQEGCLTPNTIRQKV